MRTTENLNEELFNVAKFGQAQYVKELISEGAEINAKDNSGCTPLHFASRRGNTEMTLSLISEGADVHAKNYNDNEPITLACIFFSKETALALISNGADTSQINRGLIEFRGLTMHQAAAQGGFTSRAMDLLRDHPSSLPQDAPEALAALSKRHGKLETTAAIQSFMATKAIESILRAADEAPASPKA